MLGQPGTGGIVLFATGLDWPTITKCNRYYAPTPLTHDHPTVMFFGATVPLSL